MDLDGLIVTNSVSAISRLRMPVRAVLRDGSRVAVRGLALKRVRRIEIRTRFSGYTITPLTVPAGATARLMYPAAQSSAPNAGPTLAIRLGRSVHAAFTARLTPGR